MKSMDILSMDKPDTMATPALRPRLAPVINLDAARHESHTLTVPLDLDLSPSACIARAMQRSTFRGDLQRIQSTWSCVGEYTKRLAELLTDRPPGTTGRTLLGECLDAACFQFLAAPANGPAILAPARFLAAGISVASRGLLTYQISAAAEVGSARIWLTQEGFMSHFVTRQEARELRFAPRAAATTEERYAMKSWLCNALLHYDDMVLLVRAGVEPRTFDAG